MWNVLAPLFPTVALQAVNSTVLLPWKTKVSTKNFVAQSSAVWNNWLALLAINDTRADLPTKPNTLTASWWSAIVKTCHNRVCHFVMKTFLKRFSFETLNDILFVVFTWRASAREGILYFHHLCRRCRRCQRYVTAGCCHHLQADWTVCPEEAAGTAQPIIGRLPRLMQGRPFFFVLIVLPAIALSAINKNLCVPDL